MPSTSFLSLRGSPALSPFRLDKLYATLKQSAPSITHIYAEFVHFAFSEAPLSDAQQQSLKQILTYGPQAQLEEPVGELFLVVRALALSHLGRRALQILPIIAG